MITALYAALLALWLVVLSLRVIALRGNPLFAFLAFQSAGEETLQRAVRGHGNFTEYTPMMLILLYLLEVQGSDATLLHGLGIAFLIGRIAHGLCFGFTARSMPLRIAGTVLSLTSLLTAALLLL